MIAVFNKQNKKFIFFATSDIGLGDRYFTRDVGHINPMTDTYWGDYDEGHVVEYGSAEHTELLAANSLYDEKVVVAERTLREAVHQRIIEKHHYDLESCVNIVIDMLHNSGIKETPAFTKMVKTIRVEEEHLSKSLNTYATDESFQLIPQGAEQEFMEQQVVDAVLNNL